MRLPALVLFALEKPNPMINSNDALFLGNILGKLFPCFFVLNGRIDELGLPREKYEWYLDLRRNGTVNNSGFTLRFDLMVLFATGLGNVRDVIPFPRSYGKAYT